MSPLDSTTASASRLARAMITTMLRDQRRGRATLGASTSSHHEGRRFRADRVAGEKKLVSTFGHGRHTCPRSRRSGDPRRRWAAIYLRLVPRFSSVVPRLRVIGGVARAALSRRLQRRWRKAGSRADRLRR
jgi:hypothetical protein